MKADGHATITCLAPPYIFLLGEYLYCMLSLILHEGQGGHAVKKHQLYDKVVGDSDATWYKYTFFSKRSFSYFASNMYGYLIDTHKMSYAALEWIRFLHQCR